MQDIKTFPFGQFLDAIAAKTPAPGGGAVASAVGALAAALASMVVAYSLAKKNLAAHQPALERAAKSLERARGLLLELAQEDAAAYAQVNELQRLPDSDERRRREFPVAAAAAVQAPRATLGACCDLLRLCESLGASTNRMLRSDLAIAAVLAEAGARAAWWNVSVNLTLLPDGPERQRIEDECRGLLEQAAVRRAAVESACAP